MCGICGIASAPGAKPVDERQLLRMRETLRHRGPDDAGIYLDEQVGLASTRLSILDLSPRGHMPMRSADGRYWIVYNGETYNFQELRAYLEAAGYIFLSNTDTEVVLYLYIHEGAKMLPRLNGMFAFAIWDSQEKRLFLARDRLGVKPLYYYLDGENRLYFASEEKALFAAGVPCEFDPRFWEELLLFRYVAGENTCFSGVKRLLPGHSLTWEAGRLSGERWWNLAERVQHLRAPNHSDGQFSFVETFDSAVNLRRISDVPIGVLLSGGLDSGSVAASLAMQAGGGVASFTVRFQEAAYDEGKLAAAVAQRWGLDYHELFISPNELLDSLKEASWINDEPLAHGNDLHLYRLSQFARPLVTVLLSGEGGDETLGGYVRYQPLRYARWLKPGQSFSWLLSWMPRPRLKKLKKFLELGSPDLFVLYNSCDVLPQDLEQLGFPTGGEFPFRQSILREARQLYPGDYIRQVMYYDQHAFLCSILDRNDRMTMGASIECRVPFLDFRLVENLAALPSTTLFRDGMGKSLLKKQVGNRLPEAVLRHRKWGFGVPWERYLRQQPELRQLVEDLPDMSPIRESPLDRERLRRLAREFLGGNDEAFALIKQLVMIVVWFAAYRERIHSLPEAHG